ncbi:hypothetical protein Psi02_60910 [Planotetraspora silvatica]|uniref:Uncharacterized protein n=1 Tax=Planotetraspora silvatica TaxID=234614 RepID=A0A8J3UR02_9ACTN|nr:hypothetical protein Psi02_60910 [Planotetraspora silvatica]
MQSFYAKAAKVDGWTPEIDPTGPPRGQGEQCFTKTIDGTTAHLHLWYPADLEATGERDQYGIEITASHDGGAWC